MADENKTFMEESQEYADKYRAAIKEGYSAFMDISTELIARGIKTKDQIIADAKQFGIDVKEATITKALQVKGIVLDATGKVVQAGKDAKAWVDGKVQDGKEWVDGKVQAGKEWVDGKVQAGREAVQAGKEAVVQGYRDTRDAVKSGIDTAGKWVGDKAQKTGKAIRTGAAMGMGAVILGADVTIKGVKKVGSKVGEKGQEVGRMAVAAKKQAVEKAKGLWARAKEKARAGKEWVEGKVQAGKDWVEDKAETAAIGAMLAADKVKGKVEDVILDAGIALEDAKEWVGDKAETVAIGAMLAADKVKDGAKTVAAMGMGAVLLGKDVAIKGVKKIGDKGKEVGRMAVEAKDQAVEKAKGLWARVKQKAKDGKTWVDGKVQAGKDAVVQGYRDTRDAVKSGIDTASKWVDDRVQDGRDAVQAGKEWVGDKVQSGKDAVVQGYRETREAIKDVRTDISVRTDLGISSLQDGFASFFSGLGNKLAAQAVSRKERAEQARNARDAEKNAVNKAEQDKDGEAK